MKKLGKMAVAGIASLLASTMVHAVPIMDGIFSLDATSTIYPTQLFTIDATGFDNLTLAFTAIGAGSIDPCDGRYNQDCLAISIAQTEILAGLTVTNQWQSFGPISLAAADSSFDMVFSSRITGADEAMTVNWQLSGDEIQNIRVLLVSEPGPIALLSLGLIGFVLARRRFR